jgi:plasmid stability protein
MKPYYDIKKEASMKAVTIRGVDPEVAEKLKLTAAQQGKSVNQLTIEIIKESLGMQKEKKHTRVYNDLDELFGQWDKAEFKKINAKIGKERRIDPELWA